MKRDENKYIRNITSISFQKYFQNKAFSFQLLLGKCSLNYSFYTIFKMAIFYLKVYLMFAYLLVFVIVKKTADTKNHH